MPSTDPAIRKTRANFLRFSSSIAAKIENYLHAITLVTMGEHCFAVKIPGKQGMGSEFFSNLFRVPFTIRFLL
jgi:hypothetical protein